MYLGINLAVDPISIGLYSLQGGETNFTLNSDFEFTENLVSEISLFCEKNGQKLDDIKAVGVTKGPGSYTGLRLGVTIAKTLAQVREIPVYGFSTLEALVFQYRFFKGVYFSLLKACQNETNLAIFTVNTNQSIAFAQQPALENSLQILTEPGINFKRITADLTCASSTLEHNLSLIQSPVYVLSSIATFANFKTKNENLVFVTANLNGSTLAQMTFFRHAAGKSSDYTDLFPKYSHQVNIGNKAAKTAPAQAAA